MTTVDIRLQEFCDSEKSLDEFAQQEMTLDTQENKIALLKVRDAALKNFVDEWINSLDLEEMKKEDHFKKTIYEFFEKVACVCEDNKNIYIIFSQIINSLPENILQNVKRNS